jgi:predicted flap endonuclease-1-like 5' DNA nuclease
MPSTTTIEGIEGIGHFYGEKLRAAGIRTVEDLRNAGATPQGRDELADKTGIAAANILRWVNHADLFRIKGVGAQYAELLEAAGVDSVVELAQRNPDNLLAAMLQVNAEKHLVRSVPSLNEVTSWVAQAQTFERAVHY